MNWLFWVLLIVALAVLIAPFAGLVTVGLRVAFWIIGAILLLAAVVWAVNTMSRGTMGPTPGPTV